MQFACQKIEVDSYVRYSTDRQLQKNDADWAAYKVRCVVKGEPYKYNLNMPLAGVVRSLNSDQSHLAEEELLRQCAAHIGNRARGGGVIVPIPNSHVTGSVLSFETLRHAQKISNFAGSLFSVAPILRWKTAQQKSHLGGRSRSFRDHMANMYISSSFVGNIILYDDVVTTGSQLAAAKRVLNNAGHKVLGMLTIVSVLDKDGCTHSDLWKWKMESRTCF